MEQLASLKPGYDIQQEHVWKDTDLRQINNHNDQE